MKPADANRPLFSDLCGGFLRVLQSRPLRPLAAQDGPEQNRGTMA